MLAVACLAILITVSTSPFVMAAAATETSRTTGTHSDVVAENRTIVAGSTITAEYTVTADSRSKFVPTALELGLPADWHVRTYSAAGSFYRAQSTTWLWLGSSSSAERTVRIAVYVPRDAQGTYEIDAAVSDGLSILERHSSTVTVRQPPNAPSDPPTTAPAAPSQVTLTTSDVTAAAGSNATVHYTVENRSPTAIHGLTLDLGLPADDWVVTDHTDDRGNFVPETHSWSWSRIPPNESRTVSATVAVPADASGTYEIGATVARPSGISFARPSTVTVPGTADPPRGTATPTPTGPETPADDDAPGDPQTPPISDSPFEPGPPNGGGPPVMTGTATPTPPQAGNATSTPTRSPTGPSTRTGTPPVTTTPSRTTGPETTTKESPPTPSPTRPPTPTPSTPTATRTTAPPQTTEATTQTRGPTTTAATNTPAETTTATATGDETPTTTADTGTETAEQTTTQAPKQTAARTTAVNETAQQPGVTTQTVSQPGNQSSTTTVTGPPADSTPTAAQTTTSTTSATATTAANPTATTERASEADAATEDESEADADGDAGGWLVNIYPPSAERAESTTTSTPTSTPTPTPTPTPTRTATPQSVRVSGTADWIVAMETQPIQRRPSSSFVRFGGNTTGLETVEFTRVHEGTATVRRVVPGTYGSPMDALAVYDVNVSEQSPVERANVTIDLTTLGVDDASTLTFHVRRGDSWEAFDPSNVNRGPGTVTLTVRSLEPIAVTESPAKTATPTWVPPTTTQTTTTDSLRQEQISVQSPAPAPQPPTTTTTASSPISGVGSELPIVLAVGGLVIALLVHRYRGR